MDSLDQISGRLLNLKTILWYLCNDCFDSGLVWEKTQPSICQKCEERKDLPAASARLMRAVFERMGSNKLINKQQFDVARALVKSEVNNPVPLNILIHQFQATDRTIKSYVESLRTEWLLPIGSSKFPPSGYYWINTAEECKAFYESFLAQPYQEIRTANRLIKANFPELAGQIQFDFKEANS